MCAARLTYIPTCHEIIFWEPLCQSLCSLKLRGRAYISFQSFNVSNLDVQFYFTTWVRAWIWRSYSPSNFSSFQVTYLEHYRHHQTQLVLSLTRKKMSRPWRQHGLIYRWMQLSLYGCSKTETTKIQRK